MFFKKKKIQKEVLAFVELMQSMSQEADRVYRNQVQIYADENPKSRAEVTGKGLFKARAHAVTFLVAAFQQRWPKESEKVHELFNISSGIALVDLVKPDSDVTLDRDEALGFAPNYMMQTLKAALKENINPSSATSFSEAFIELEELYHEALAESFHEYDDGLRSHFDMIVKGGIFSGLSHAAKVANL